MKNSFHKRSGNTTSPRAGFTLNPVAAGCAVFVLGMSGQVFAQTAPAQPAASAPSVQTVTVSGIRRGIESAITVKRDSDSIVEAISAEDIGKLPDSSIAESIARMPGVAAQRVDGRAQTISFRGMSGDFAGTLLNGREQVSTGDNRGVEFDQYPSELMSAVVFYKTPDAALVGQGLSGTVDLQTVRPLAFGGRTIAANVRGERNSKGSLNSGYSATGNRVSASYIDQYNNRTLGLAIGYAHLDSPGQSEQYESWGYPTNDAGQYALGGSKQYTVSSKNKRDGLMAVLEWRPSSTYSSQIDMYYSEFSQDQMKRGLEAGTVWGSGALQPNFKIENNFLTQGTFVGARPVLVTRPEIRDDTLLALGWNHKYNLNKEWTLSGDLSYSKAKRRETLAEFYAGAAAGVTDTLSYTSAGSNSVPTFKYNLNYADANSIRLIDSGGWGQDGYIKYPHVEDELKSFRADIKHSMDGFFSAFTAGANYSERSKDKKTTEFLANLKTSPTTVPSNLLVAPTSLGYVGIPGVLSFDALGALPLYNLKQNLYWDIFDKNWEVTEKVLTAYAKLGIDTELSSSVTLRGNLGVQLIRVDQHSTAFAVNDGSSDGKNIANINGGTDYSDVLPSANLVFGFPGEQSLRLGASKVVARPRMDQMRAATNASVDVAKRTWSGKGGNPELEPWRANSYDVSYEKYFGKQAYLGAAYYHKKLETYIYTQSVSHDFSGVDSRGIVPISNIGAYETPVNGQGGKVSGFELSVSAPLNLITPMLDGFGVVMSKSWNDSSIESNGPGSKEPIAGLSKQVRNITAYYEKYGFSARISERARSKFKGEVTGFGAGRENVYIRPETVRDVQLGYEFQDGALKGMSILLQVNNLNNAKYETQFGETDAKLKVSNSYGRTVLLGVNYKM
ncbi:MAG TPA: TonB-dependent receptor [Burkholderiaceae bacterium]